MSPDFNSIENIFKYFKVQDRATEPLQQRTTEKMICEEW